MNHFSRSKVFLYGLVAFVSGIFVGGIRITERIEILIPVLIILFLGMFGMILSVSRIVKFFIILIVLFSLGLWRYQSYLPKIDENHVSFYTDNGENYLIEGVVHAEPVGRDNNLKLQISNNKFQITDKYQNPNYKLVWGDILLSVPNYYEVSYGDAVRFRARLVKPTSFETFDYAGYLARYGVYAVAKSVDDFEIVSKGNLGVIPTALFKIKKYFSYIIQKIYPEPHAAFMLGLLAGEKRSLPGWLMEIFRIVGITHIIAISGYNITILAKVAEKTLGRIGRKFIFWGVLAMIISFVVMTGAQASIVRAGIMGALLVYAGFIGRKSNAVNILIFAGVAMIFFNPLILRFDAGFQLSFLATLGLIYISPIFEMWFKKIPGFFRTMLSATLAAQVLTLPIIISSFGTLSLIAPLANVIVLGFIPITMFLGFLSGGLGMIWLSLGQIVGFFGYIVLELIIRVSEFLSRIPYAAIDFKMSNWVFWSGYYVVVGVVVWWWHRKQKLQTPKDEL